MLKTPELKFSLEYWAFWEDPFRKLFYRRQKIASLEIERIIFAEIHYPIII